MQTPFHVVFSVIFVILLGTLAGHAQNTGLPPLLPKIFIVTGVAQDDALNVRLAPLLKSEKIGALASGAQVEVTAMSPDTKWARILFEDQDGWVAARYLALAAGSQKSGSVNGGIPKVLACIGTEPFWSLDVTVSDMVAKMEFRNTETKPKTWANAVVSAPVNRGFRSFAAVDDDVAAVFGRHECSDDMSDRTYGWTLDLLLRGDQTGYLQGCCRMTSD